jgi:hypothetical protein
VNKRIITAAALVAGLLVQTQGFTQVPISTDTSASTVADAGKMSDPEKAARRTWAAVMKNIPVPGKGCFHVSYPNVAWESVECKEAKPRAHPAPRRPPVGAPMYVGDDTDWVAGSTQGVIVEAAGRFFISGVTSETNYPNNDCAPPAEPPGSQTKCGILGPNEYTLQLNTNQTYTPACNGNGNCTAWQQFIYSTDGDGSGTAALYMQYWLFNVGNCPSSPWGIFSYLPGWQHPPGDETDCYTNSALAQLPDIPVTELGNVILEGQALPGRDDCVILNYGDEWFESICEGDGVLDIGSVWFQAEFNVVGDGDMSQADFNAGSQITVQLGFLNGSNYPPVCLGADGPKSFPGQGTTGETNNLTLGACQTGVGPVAGSSFAIDPYIQFVESLPLPSTPCLSCGGGGGSPPPPPIKP